MFWMVTLAIVITAIVVIVVMNLGRSDKTVSCHLTHHFTVADPQFHREMSV